MEIGLKLTAKKGHIGSALGKMLQSIVEEPETGKEHTVKSLSVFHMYTDHANICALF